MSYAVPVASLTQLPEDLVLLELDTAGTPLAGSYRHAGQYVTLSTPHSQPGYFAMASAPGEPRFQFLIKVEAHKPKTAALGRLGPGDIVTVSPVHGAGYPLDQQAGHDLLLVASGTGVSPLRALLGEITSRRGEFGSVRLLYGAAHQDSLAFADEHRHWKNAHVELIPVLSRPQGDWQGARGYVQDLIAKLPLDPNNTAAFLAGHKTMIHRVAAVLKSRGVPSGCIIANF